MEQRNCEKAKGKNKTTYGDSIKPVSQVAGRAMDYMVLSKEQRINLSGTINATGGVP